jgi:hypothetical protein
MQPCPGLNQHIAIGSFQVFHRHQYWMFQIFTHGVLILYFSRELLPNNKVYCKLFLDILKAISV